MSILNKLNGAGRCAPVSLRGIQCLDPKRPTGSDLLNLTGFPLDMPEKGIYSFMPGFRFGNSCSQMRKRRSCPFSRDRGFPGKNFSESFRSLVSRSLRGGFVAFFVKLPEIPANMKNFPFVKELEQRSMIAEGLIKYESAKGIREHRLCPLKWSTSKVWYLLACRTETPVRKFRIEKIKGLELLDENFDPPRNLKAALERSVNIWFSEEPGEKILLEIDKDAAHYFKKKIYSRNRES